MKNKQIFIIVICSVLFVVLAGIIGLWYLDNYMKRIDAICYEISPRDFHKQKKNIKIGASENEAIEQIKIYNKIERKEGITNIILLPKNDKNCLIHYITLHLDKDGKVVEVFGGDG